MRPSTLPRGWPEEFPLPPGSVVVQADSSAMVARTFFTVPGGIDLWEFFARTLPASGWAVGDAQICADGDSTFELEGHGLCGQVEWSPPGPEGSRVFWIQFVW